MENFLAVTDLAGCGPKLTYNSTPMEADEVLDRASHIFIGVIEDHNFDTWPLFRFHIPAADAGTPNYWKVMRRRVRVETVIRGAETRKLVDVYEIFWTGGASGDWNATQDGERALFILQVEDGRYHLIRDGFRNIFPITTGPHARLPFDELHPLIERIGLLNFWVESPDPSFRIVHPQFRYNRLDYWRTIKLERGLVRHPSQGVRVPACRSLLMSGFGQDVMLGDAVRGRQISSCGRRLC